MVHSHFIGRKTTELAVFKSCSSTASMLFGFWGFPQKPHSFFTATVGCRTYSFRIWVMQNFSNSFNWKKVRPWSSLLHLLRSMGTLLRIMPTSEILDLIITCLWCLAGGFTHHVTHTLEPSPTRVKWSTCVSCIADRLFYPRQKWSAICVSWPGRKVWVVPVNSWGLHCPVMSVGVLHE